MKPSTIYGIVAFCVSMFVAWMSGIDIFTRSSTTGIAYTVSLVIAITTKGMVGLDERKYF